MLTNKIAVVTGASRGIGRAVAKVLAKQGAMVIINYNGSEAKAEEVKKEIIDAGGQAQMMQCNVSEYDACEAFIKEIVDTYGRIDILVKLIVFAATMDWEFSMNYELDGLTDATQHDGFGGGLCEMMFNVKATDLENADKVACPVLLCQASKDIIINQTMKDQISDAFPDATYYTVEGGGHQCIENRAEELCGVTVDFLNK